ncbi:hypothetical protein Ancab_009917 [Ancistrocladus abbreviatus]
MEGKKMVHIFDLHSFEPAQWINLLQAISSQPRGPPHLKFMSIHEQKVVLEQMALQMHSLLAYEDRMPRGNSLAAPEYTGLVHLQKALNVKEELIDKDLIIANESTMLSIPLLPTSPKLKAFLFALLCLSPKLMVLTEKESDHNSSSMERVMEALNFYVALFDGLEFTMPRESLERRRAEKCLFGEEIQNIIACEGVERKLRHEKLENWFQRMELAVGVFIVWISFRISGN